MVFFVSSGKSGMGYLVPGEKQHGMFCPGWQIFVGCFVRGVKKWHGMFCLAIQHSNELTYKCHSVIEPSDAKLSSRSVL